MSATDELRRLLDERGVEWSSPSGVANRFADSITFIGDVAVVSEIDGSDLLRINFDGTPEQALAATLGRGTCQRVLYKPTGDPTGVLVCSECGAAMPKALDRYCFLHYCPNCGAKVVQ